MLVLYRFVVVDAPASSAERRRRGRAEDVGVSKRGREIDLDHGVMGEHATRE
jgi:hypothetical protein